MLPGISLVRRPIGLGQVSQNLCFVFFDGFILRLELIVSKVRSFGLTKDDPLIQTGMNYLLSHQHADGSWRDMRRLRYHPTWTAVDGLSQDCWRGQGLSMPGLKPLLPQ